jgi:hypothetical protein
MPNLPAASRPNNLIVRKPDARRAALMPRGHFRIERFQTESSRDAVVTGVDVVHITAHETAAGLGNRTRNRPGVDDAIRRCVEPTPCPIHLIRSKLPTNTVDTHQRSLMLYYNTVSGWTGFRALRSRRILA